MGLPCVSKPVRLGRPNKAVAVADIGGIVKMCPTDVITKYILTALEDSNGDEQKQTEIQGEAICIIRGFVWIALNRKSINLLHTTLSLARSLDMGLAEIEDILSVQYTSKMSTWNNRALFKQRIPQAVFALAKADKTYCLFRASYYGRALFFVAGEEKERFLTTEEAHRVYDKNKKDVLGCIVQDFQRGLQAMVQNVGNNKHVQFQFVEGEPLVEARINSVTVTKMKIRDREHNTFISDMDFTKITSNNGDFMIVGISMKGKLRQIESEDGQSRKGKTIGKKRPRPKQDESILGVHNKYIGDGTAIEIPNMDWLEFSNDEGINDTDFEDFDFSLLL